MSDDVGEITGVLLPNIGLILEEHTTAIMEKRNPGFPLDLSWFENVEVSLYNVNLRAAELQRHRALKNNHQAAWLLRALTCIDLTTLAGDDTESNVRRLCFKAANPLAEDLQLALGIEIEAIKSKKFTTAAVCVYPSLVPYAAQYLAKAKLADKVQVASVATGFPSGQFPLKTRLEEVRYAVESGATEIDVVVNRGLVLTERWEELYSEIKQMREACGDAHLKTILAVGELASLSNVYKASMVAMAAGSDFIKTSTGKEAINATLPIGIVMCRAIRDFYDETGVKIGFKPAGGIRTAKDSLNWLVLIKEELGDEWLCSDLFRIGASGLLTDIERQLYHHATGKYAEASHFTMA